MDKQYIKSLAEAYIIDNQLFEKDLVPEKLTEEFYSILKELREEGSDLYYILESANKFEQQKFFKLFFDIEYFPEKIFVENLEPLDEIFNPIGLLTNPYNIPAFILLYLIRKPLSKAVFGTISKISSWINIIGKELSKLGKNTQFSYTMIQHNFQKCYQQCGFDPNDASYKDYLYHYPTNSIRKEAGRLIQSEEGERKQDCLRNCYLESFKDVVILCAQSFFNCLRNTGDTSRLPFERDYNSYQLLLKNSNLSSSCNNLLTAYKESLEKFSETCDLMFDKESEIKKQKDDLMNDIYNIQKKEYQQPQNFNRRN